MATNILPGEATREGGHTGDETIREAGGFAPAPVPPLRPLKNGERRSEKIHHPKMVSLMMFDVGLMVLELQND